MWLDCDELGKIAAFVASGGVAYGRELKAREKTTGKTSTPVSMLGARRTEETPLGSVLEVIRYLLPPFKKGTGTFLSEKVPVPFFGVKSHLW